MKRPRRAAVWLLGMLAALALLAPLLAGGSPLLVRTQRGLAVPALSEIFAITPSGGPAQGGPRDEATRWSVGPLLGIDPLRIDLGRRLMPPDRRHWLGTDELGRDVLARLLHGARPSLLVALLATLVSLAAGIPLGAAAGYSGRGADLLLSRLIEGILAFPTLVLALLVAGVAIAGSNAGTSVLLVSFAIGIARAGVIARYMRGETRRLSGTDLALSARAMGADPVRVLARHLIPAGFAPVATAAAFGAGSAVLTEASLSFLGLGVQPPAPTWGQILQTALGYGPSCWWLVLFPAGAVALTVAAFNLLGESLRRPAGSSPRD